MNGEDLVYDWRHNVVGEPSEWAFNWDYAECGTPNPKNVEHYATMWLVMNEDNPIFAIKVFFTQAAQKYKNIKYKAIPPEHEEAAYKFKITDKRTKDLLLQGSMRDPTDEHIFLDPNVGNFATFQATTAKGRALMKKLVDEAKESSILAGMLAWVPHDRIETNIGDGYRVVSVTGDRPRDGDDADCKGLATRFTLFHEDEEVARCHMSYRDGSYDPSMGPTIEMLAVKQSRRGEGLAKVLWYHVRRFIETNFTIECLNNDAPLKHTMVKATQIDNSEIEIRLEKDGTRHSMGFKEFLYDYCGFNVREQKGAVAAILGGRRIKDEEAILYIPLLPRGTPSPLKVPKPGKAIYREKGGARMCHWCSKVSKDKLRCTRCGVAFYCNTSCQRNDWKRHKLWCNKSREQVRETLIQRGDMSLDDDGTEVLHINSRGFD